MIKRLSSRVRWGYDAPVYDGGDVIPVVAVDPAPVYAVDVDNTVVDDGTVVDHSDCSVANGIACNEAQRELTESCKRMVVSSSCPRSYLGQRRFEAACGMASSRRANAFRF